MNWYISCLSKFERCVLEHTRQIPYGKTLTYSEMAEIVGRPGASRAIGRALAKNPFPLVIPCHRVVGKNNIGGYTGGSVDLKRKLLEMEQIRSSKYENKE